MKPDIPENQSLPKGAQRLHPPRHAFDGGRKDLEIPNYLTEALKMNEPARKILESSSYSNMQDYLEWLGAKLEIH